MSSQDLSPLAGLRIELEAALDEARPLTFTLNNGYAGLVEVFPGELEEKLGVLVTMTADNIEPKAIPFGRGDGVHVNLKFAGQSIADLALLFEIAYPGGNGYETVTAEAPVSAASLDRLIAGLQQLLDTGSGAFDWTVAD